MAVFGQRYFIPRKCRKPTVVTLRTAHDALNIKMTSSEYLTTLYGVTVSNYIRCIAGARQMVRYQPAVVVTFH